MFEVTKLEAEYIRKYYPNTTITKTVHKYYAEERERIVRDIERMRYGNPKS